MRKTLIQPVIRNVTAAALMLLLAGCASQSVPSWQQPRAGGYIASYDHEGAVGSGEIYMDQGAGQFGYPYAGSTMHLGVSPDARWPTADGYYGLLGPGSRTYADVYWWRAPVVYRPFRPVAALPTPPRDPVATPSVPPTPRVIPEPRQQTAGNSRRLPQRERSQQAREHRRDTR